MSHAELVIAEGWAEVLRLRAAGERKRAVLLRRVVEAVENARAAREDGAVHVARSWIRDARWHMADLENA